MAREQFQTLTEPMYYILLALLQERCGVDIMSCVMEISHGRISVGPGTLYAMLPKFEAGRIITKTRQEGRQKWYIITDKGRQILLDEHARLCRMIEDAGGLLPDNLVSSS